MSGSGQRRIGRRSFLRAAGRAALAAPFLASLASCESTSSKYPHAGDLRYPRPNDPVRWQFYPENPPIESGLDSEPGPLEVFSWDGYIAPDVLHSFEESNGVDVRVSTYYDMNQAISKLRTGAVRPDVFVPTLDVLGRLVVAGLVQPLQHDYLPNRVHLWPSLQSPFYDVGSRYSVPYAVYSTGVGWRTDMAADPGLRDDPWSVFWDTRYVDRVFLLDDYRAAIQLVLLRDGVEDINTEDARLIEGASTSLSEMAEATSVRWSLDDYTYLPEGRAWIHQAWSGDMITAPYYGSAPVAQVADTLGYWFPLDARGEVNNDVLCVPAGCSHPVLAHRFVDHLLNPDVALENFAWVGYQQPLSGLTRSAASQAYPWLQDHPLAAAFVTENQLASGYRQLELSAAADALWQQSWLRFRSHG